ncbi:MlaD family protein [Mycolicibacterium insubricum]|uniref:Mammalian cell entry protein n=2 Tax=Mycolicibacterium insubricum TaxID=444597 RepID=A0A1X0D3W5_9MYCO|nr:MlaD family protein [Mycolicibacterium insubricum]ORA66862.1 mammalian cell entry protein [Mycolicibacterium insubricum]
MMGKVADGLVGTVKYAHGKKAWLSAIALLLVLVLATLWIMVNALRFNPFVGTYLVSVDLAESGGLLADQDVTLRGVAVGKVDDLTLTPSGVHATLRLNNGVHIPDTTGIRVSGLSAAGEQYVNLDGNGDGAPLRDGGVINGTDAKLPVSLADLLAHGDGFFKQLDTEKLKVIRKELSMSTEGPQKLADIVDGGAFLLSTLDGVLPETTKTLRTSRVALNLIADKNAGMHQAANNISGVLTGVNKMRDGYRKLTEITPATLNQADNLFDDNSDTMVELLGSLASTSQLLYLRVPALSSLWPNYRGSMLDALGSTMHDYGVWVNLDIYPRYTCDYGTPRRPPSSADYPEPFMYTYCRDDDPAVLIRGAKNAPRPAGDDTAGPPQGADLGAQTDPTPKGRYTIPTEYGGPTLPMEPPR